MNDISRTARIAGLNDALRRSPGPGWVLTSGVAELGHAFAEQAILRIVAFDRFTPQNDPRGERGSGSLRVLGRWVSWRIGYHDISLTTRSPDPADDKLTRRIITVMLLGEE